MIGDDKLSKPDQYIDVTIRLPKPPDGWEYVRWDHAGELQERGIFKLMNDQHGKTLILRRIWTPPANAVGTFYHRNEAWVFTDGDTFSSANGNTYSTSGKTVPATVFSDFTPPPERKPYRVDRGVVGKDGAT